MRTARESPPRRSQASDRTPLSGPTITVFDPVKVGDDGTVYVVWSDTQNIYLTHSTNGGVSWAPKVRVNDNSVYKTNVMSWLEAGSDGRVCVVWFGTPSASNNDNADWQVMFDSEPEKAVATRKRVYDMVSAEKMFVAGYHFPFPGLGWVEKAGNGYRLIPAPWNPVL